MSCLIRIKSDIKAGQAPEDPVIFRAGTIVKKTLTVALAMINRGEAEMVDGCAHRKPAAPKKADQKYEQRK